jgi:hypothetical protein
MGGLSPARFPFGAYGSITFAVSTNQIGVEAKLFFCLRMVPDAITATLGGPLLSYQRAPFAILKPKNRKTEKPLDGTST